LSYELSLCASGLADRLGDLEFPARLGDLESPVLLGDLEFRSDRLGDRELRPTGDRLGDREPRATGDRLGDREPRPTGDLDLFEAGDASLAFRAGDRSLDPELLLLGERDLLGDLLRDLPPLIFASSVNRNLFP